MIYAGEDICFCVVSTGACLYASLEGLPYSVNTITLDRTEEKKLRIYKYCLQSGVISLKDDGARVKFLLLDLENTPSSAQSTTTNLTVLGI